MTTASNAHETLPDIIDSDLSDVGDVDMLSDEEIQEGQQEADTQASSPAPRLSRPPRTQKVPTSVQATAFAPVYKSAHIGEKINAHLIPHLHHVNCSYLSTPGVAPTLTQLKQHAQSLAILIKSLTLSTRPVVIDAASVHSRSGLPGKNPFPTAPDGETWDWLNDLSIPYEGPSNTALRPHHSLPLTSLLNTLETVQTTHRKGSQQVVRDRCPLYHAEAQHLVTNPAATALPYTAHQALIAHANQTLELIDHEYSAKGGLLSILPPKDDVQDREKAESTLLGQYILFTQRLVARLHEIEREYADALDVLKGEAKVPLQMLSKLGPQGRKGREVAYPQDRFVLVNAGEDVWAFLDAEFADKEQRDDVARKEYLAQGVIGERLWAQDGEREFARGITAIDITTRYFRLRDDPLKTVFVIPAWGKHPGVTTTREMQQKPTVVSVVRPVWPERQSLWEQRHRSDEAELKQLRHEVTRVKSSIVSKDEDNTFLNLEYEKKAQEARDLAKRVKVLEDALEQDEENGAGREIYARYNEMTDREMQANLRVEAAEQAVEEAETRERATEERIRNLEKELELRRQAVVQREKEFEKRRKRKLDEMDEMESSSKDSEGDESQSEDSGQQ